MGIEYSFKKYGRIFLDFNQCAIELISFKHLLSTNELIFYCLLKTMHGQSDFYCFKYDIAYECSELKCLFALESVYPTDIVPCSVSYSDMFLLKDEDTIQLYKNNLCQTPFYLDMTFIDNTSYHQLKWTNNDEAIIGSTYAGALSYFDVSTKKVLSSPIDSSEKCTSQGFYEFELIEADLLPNCLCFSPKSGGVCLFDYDKWKKIGDICPNVKAGNLSFNSVSNLLCLSDCCSGVSYLYDIRKLNVEVGKVSVKANEYLLQQKWSKDNANFIQTLYDKSNCIYRSRITNHAIEDTKLFTDKDVIGDIAEFQMSGNYLMVKYDRYCEVVDNKLFKYY